MLPRYSAPSFYCAWAGVRELEGEGETQSKYLETRGGSLMVIKIVASLGEEMFGIDSNAKDLLR